MPLLTRVAAHAGPVVRLQRARPAPASGVRAAVATAVPLAVGLATGAPGLSFAALAGFLTTIADKGGSYRTRATTMGALALAGTLAVALGGLAGGDRWLRAPLAFAVVAACGFALAYGAAAGSVGTSTAILFVVALATPEPAREALVRAAVVLAGSLWAMALALWLWPVRPYRPAREAVAGCWRALGALAAEVASPHASRADAAFQAGLATRSTELRAAIESARAVLAATRRGRAGETPRGERLLVLLESCDQLFGLVAAISEVVKADEPPEALASFGAAARELASYVERERARPEDVPAWDAGAVDGPAARGPASALLGRVGEYWSVAADAAAGISVATPFEILAPSPSPAARETLRAHLTTRSVVFRHAMRTATTAAAAVALADALGLRRGYWVTISALVIVQPYVGASTTKGLQRVAGTLVGCALTAVLASVAQTSPVGLLAVVFVLAAAGVALLPVNYTYYTIFTTATFVLLAESSAGDWHLVEVRVVNTAIGGALALAATWLLWPEHERQRAPEQLARLLRANADYLDGALAALASGASSGEAAAEARRAVGLASINAEASFQRLLSEAPGDEALLEPTMALLTYNRRLSRGVTAMLASPPSDAASLAAPGRASARALRDLADALERGTSLPTPEALPDAAPGSPLEGTARRLRMMADAAARLRATAPAPRSP